MPTGDTPQSGAAQFALKSCGDDSPPPQGIVDTHVSQIAGLLQSLEEASQIDHGIGQPAGKHERRLVDARLGVASSLFTALRCKHVPTALHCLRVSVGCSAWSQALDVPSYYRDALEVAALLHDVGKIGVPDDILLKPGKLQPEEAALMARHRGMAVDILSSCCLTPDVIEIVRYASAWYDGSSSTLKKKEDNIPFGARLLAIVDAFDAMTTDHVYRPAKSRERAFAELFECSGTQFDPTLVRHFSDVFASQPQKLTKVVASHWIRAIADQETSIEWGCGIPSRLVSEGVDDSSLFAAMLIDNMHDGVIFVDTQQRIFVWNTGVERLTGVAASAAKERLWTPSLFEMRDVKGKTIHNEDCPVKHAIDNGVQSIKRVFIAGRNGREVVVDLHAVPVSGDDRVMRGATVLLQDASPEASLEEQCQALHDKATKDPLTQVANRAEFDRMHSLFIDAHLDSSLTCSLIITDIDRFKSVNDTYGHQAGDEAIQSYAALLKTMCRSGDLVARYGGEEFVILCADCNNAAAARRAEQIRRKIAETPIASLGNRSISASFGVTELQRGDTPETMLRRADRALLQAKDHGRNQVVQLGGGMTTSPEKKTWWPFNSARNQALLECELITVVPIAIAARKLRGFIADHSARITSTGEDHLYMEVAGDQAGQFRREEDRPVPFVIEMTFSEEHVQKKNSVGFAAGDYVQTRAHVIVRPKRDRDRRKAQSAERARHLLCSMKSYLMAKEESEEDDHSTERFADADGVELEIATQQ